MTLFSSRNVSSSSVPTSSSRIWPLLRDPNELASLTPLVRSIVEDGDTWVWSLAGFSALGLTVAPTFTERMTFDDRVRIDFRHQPPPGSDERAGATGTYLLTLIEPGSTLLHVDITLFVELPLPRLAGRAVENVMSETMKLAGSKFAHNMYVRLGLDPSTIRITERRHRPGDAPGS